MSADTALWYASRATGVVCLLLMTAVVLLGVLVNRQGRLPGLPRFAVTGLHRNLSLLAVLFLADPRADRDPGPVRDDRAGRDRGPAGLAVPAGVDRPGRGRP